MSEIPPFLMDQALAEVREHARRTDTFTLLIAKSGSAQCSWCQCDVTRDDIDHQCGGCPARADVVMHQFTPQGARNDVPLCESHLPDAIHFVAALYAVRATE
ncbi:hypothetical protein [Streptomyces sp. 8L]|uniref:hypothetical protein n=1 Tax=Streptomyces sp. 8L TaxID=2877242 RepID=UPI001CD46C6C|nr:hypothetical protein [Streptomyces sp. 8L]MCA1218669.1 hypothetical protein [Streptomyces sp. 8L]